LLAIEEVMGSGQAGSIGSEEFSTPYGKDGR